MMEYIENIENIYIDVWISNKVILNHFFLEKRRKKKTLKINNKLIKVKKKIKFPLLNKNKYKYK